MHWHLWGILGWLAAIAVMPSGPLRHLLSAGLIAAAMAVAWRGLHRLHARKLWLTTIALGLSTAGLSHITERVSGIYPGNYFGLVEIGYGIGYPITLLGCFGLARQRSRDRWTGISATLEAVAVGCGFGMLAWQLVIQPHLHGDVSEVAVGVGYPAADLAITVMITRLALAGPANRAAHWLVAMMGVLTLADLAYLGGASAAVVSPGWIFTYVAFAIATWQTDLPELTRAARIRADGPARLWTLAPAVAAMPITMAASVLIDRPITWPVAFLGVLCAAALVARLTTLLLDHRHVSGELLRLAQRDPLTGLANRRHLHERLGDAALRGRGFSVLHFVDLDRFKEVNDRYGHMAGDAVLQVCAERLLRVIRPGDLVCRYAGDEFVIACADVDDGSAETIAERIARVLTAPIEFGGTEVSVGASIGTVAIDGTRSIDDLLDEADRAMYATKSERARSPRPG